MNILIKNCHIFCDDSESPIILGDVAIEGSRLVKVGSEGALPPGWQPERVIDGGNYLCLPGLINCHTHAAMTLLRSYADDLPLMHWLEKKIWPVENRLTGEDVYWGSLLAMMEMIRSGTTTFNDMYFFMDEVAQAVEKIGIRACLSRGLVGVGGTARVGLKESRKLIEKWQGGAKGRIRIWLGPHAPYTCPPGYIKKVLSLAKEYETGIHIHVAETRDEIRIINERYSKTPVTYLEELGVFEFPVLAAHCVHLTGDDISLLARRGVAVAHNPESNMKLASGVAPVVKLRGAGITVGIGTDGAASNNNLDMFGEMRTAALLHKVFNEDPLVMPALEVLRMATGDGARALGLGDEIGVLKPGYKADLILVDLKQPHYHPRHNLVAHAVYAAGAGDVDLVIIDGEIIMENRKILTIDEERVLDEVERCARRLTSGFN
ncbi:MAG TPA: amidohydrolase [Syntrophomonadaceae bacterium]|nr:amidohydrolase [Syntrophomonadaceae bacterium]